MFGLAARAAIVSALRADGPALEDVVLDKPRSMRGRLEVICQATANLQDKRQTTTFKTMLRSPRRGIDAGTLPVT
jgi:hypothetical protein